MSASSSPAESFAQSQPSRGDLLAGAPILGRVDLLGRIEAERAAHPPVLQERRGVAAIRVLRLEAFEDRAVQDRLAVLGVGIDRLDDRRELLVVAGDQQARGRPEAPEHDRGLGDAQLRAFVHDDQVRAECGLPLVDRPDGPAAQADRLVGRPAPAGLAHLGGDVLDVVHARQPGLVQLVDREVAADDAVPPLELGRLAQGVVDGRVGEGGQERAERFARRTVGFGQAEDGQGQEMRLPRAGWAPDQAEAMVEDPLERRELARRHAVGSGQFPVRLPDRRGHLERAGGLVRPFDQVHERGIGLPVELGQMGEDLIDVEVGEPLLQEVVRARPELRETRRASRPGGARRRRNPPDPRSP